MHCVTNTLLECLLSILLQMSNLMEKKNIKKLLDPFDKREKKPILGIFILEWHFPKISSLIAGQDLNKASKER